MGIYAIYGILHTSIYVLRVLRRIDGNKLFLFPWNFFMFNANHVCISVLILDIYFSKRVR